jgi:uncharacterized membrane protein YdjX (TVP38/TMEM64 family)
MIVDDRYLRIGSANFANRSMGLDTECDLTLEAMTLADRAFVRHTTARLLAEHLGCEESLVQAELDADPSLIATLDRLDHGGPRRLVVLQTPLDAPRPPLFARLGDPEAPIELNSLADLLASDEDAPPGAAPIDPHSRPRTSWAFAAIAVVAVALTLAWRYTPLSEHVSPQRAVAWARDFGQSPWAPWVVLLAYVPGCWIMFPRPIITLFAVLAFGPWLGFTYALAGLVIAALATYGIGRMLSPQRVMNLMGPRLTGIVDVLRRRGLIAMTAMRLVPLAPFAVEGLAAGALRIKLWHFTLGSAFGLLPGTLAATVFSNEVQALLAPGSRLNWPLILSMALPLAIATAVVRRWFHRQQAGTSA